MFLKKIKSIGYLKTLLFNMLFLSLNSLKKCSIKKHIKHYKSSFV